MYFSSSSSSSPSSPSSGQSAPSYFGANRVRTEVSLWSANLIAAGPSLRTITWIEHKKLDTGVDHEYLLFRIGNPLFVTERNDEDPPDYMITEGKQADTLLATLQPGNGNTLPERTFARILALVSAKVSNYTWYRNNCYWYAGSVYESIRVGLPGVTHTETGDFFKRGKVKIIFRKSVGAKPVVVPMPVFATTLPTSPGVPGVPLSSEEWVFPVELPGEELPEELPEELSGMLSYEKFIQEFGNDQNLNAYRKMYEHNIGKLPGDFKDDLEKKLTIALRGLVGSILRDLAGPLKPGEVFEDLPVLKAWLEEDRAQG